MVGACRREGGGVPPAECWEHVGVDKGKVYSTGPVGTSKTEKAQSTRNVKKGEAQVRGSVQVGGRL